MNFISDFRCPQEINPDSYWFLINEQKIIVLSENGAMSIPRYNTLKEYEIRSDHIQYMGTYNNISCYAAEIESTEALPGCLVVHPPLTLLDRLDSDLVRLSGLAGQFITWSRNHRFCGKCGGSTKDKNDERAKICTPCGQVYYPRLSPAIIVAVTKDDKLLLASSPRFRSKFYSVLAGFVEPGETLEGCVKREIKEEVGIEVKNIKYFDSQPWPFPDSLMIGFTAEYDSGEIKPDKKEIVDVGWFKRDEIPGIPSSISIARRLIDWFIEGGNH
ncbi:MAG: NAD(+) diphosphatase [Desulfatiglans sp.]|jgi:NAD+ diphosphatase|nr:NAD(+) diphosphatase [Desulfatiglans sp.]